MNCHLGVDNLIVCVNELRGPFPPRAKTRNPLCVRKDKYHNSQKSRTVPQKRRLIALNTTSKQSQFPITRHEKDFQMEPWKVFTFLVEVLIKEEVEVYQHADRAAISRPLLLRSGSAQISWTRRFDVAVYPKLSG